MTGLTDKFPEPLIEMLRLVDQIQHHAAQFIQLFGQDICRMLTRWHIRVAEAMAAQLALQNVIGKPADHLAATWGAEAHRIVHRVLEGVTLVREAWRDIENIARLQLFVDDADKRIDLQQVRVRAVLFHRHLFTHAPAATAGALDDKYVVLIQMRTNAASWHGEGDHQIVHPPVGQGAERLHQGCGRLVPVVDRLHQQGPVVLAQMIEAFKRTVADLPFPFVMADEAAVDFALHGQAGQFIGRDGIDEIGDAAFQNHRAFLPVTFDKVGPVKG